MWNLFFFLPSATRTNAQRYVNTTRQCQQSEQENVIVFLFSFLFESTPKHFRFSQFSFLAFFFFCVLLLYSITFSHLFFGNFHFVSYLFSLNRKLTFKAHTRPALVMIRVYFLKITKEKSIQFASTLRNDKMEIYVQTNIWSRRSLNDTHERNKATEKITKKIE